MTRTAALRSMLVAAAMLASSPAAGWEAPALQDGGGETAGTTRLARAVALYEWGTVAHERGDFGEAARAFAQADELVPDATALAAALVAVIKSDDAALGMALASRTAREPFDDKLTELADKVRSRFASEAGRIAVHCDSCDVRIDGETVQRGVATWVATGGHEVVIVVAGRQQRRKVMVEPAAVVTLLPLTAPSPDPPPPPPPTPGSKDDSAAGGAPAWFWASLALTAAVGAGAIASGVDTSRKHEQFAEAPTEKASVAGRNAETRTNALIGVTAGLGLITAAVGVFAVDWGGGEARAALLIDRSQLGATISGRF